MRKALRRGFIPALGLAVLLLATLAPGALAQHAYVANSGSNTVSVIDTQTDKAVGTIPVGEVPSGIAITPDGRFAYVANNGSNNVSVIDTQTNRVVATIPVGNPHPMMFSGIGIDYPHPVGIAITPDGRFAYVANSYSSESSEDTVNDPNDVSVIDTQTNQVVASIHIGIDVRIIAITPDGRTVYVNNYPDGYGLGVVSAIATQTNQVVGSVSVGGTSAIAITPDGQTAYVGRLADKVIYAINTHTNQKVGRVTLGNTARAIAISPDGSTAYVALGEHNVLTFDTQTNQVIGLPIKVGSTPSAIAITPDGRTAYVANYDSNSLSAIDTQTNKVVGPQISVGEMPTAIAIASEGTTASNLRVRVKCPASAKPGGCKFRLQAVTRKRKGKAESAVARAKAKAGRSALVSLKPKSAFSTKLAAVKKVLVKEKLTIAGSKRTLFRRLKVVR